MKTIMIALLISVVLNLSAGELFTTEIRKHNAYDYVMNVAMIDQIEETDYVKNLRTGGFSTEADGKTDGKDPKKGGVVNLTMVNTWKDLSGPTNLADAKNSMLFCQIAAIGQINLRYNNDISNSLCGTKQCNILHANDFFDEINKCMMNVGYLGIDFNMLDYNIGGTSVTVSKLLLDIIAAIATDGASLVVMNEAISTLKSMGSDSAPLVLWDSKSHSSNVSAFQVGHFANTAGSLSYSTGAMQLSQNEVDVTCFFFFHVNNSNAHLQKGNYSATLDENVYKSARDTIVTRLGDRAQKYVLNIPLPPV